MKKQKTTINIDVDLLKAIKLKALDLDITQTELITLYFKYGLVNHNKIKTKFTDKLYKKYLSKINFKKNFHK